MPRRQGDSPRYSSRAREALDVDENTKTMRLRCLQKTHHHADVRGFDFAQKR